MGIWLFKETKKEFIRFVFKRRWRTKKLQKMSFFAFSVPFSLTIVFWYGLWTLWRTFKEQNRFLFDRKLLRFATNIKWFYFHIRVNSKFSRSICLFLFFIWFLMGTEHTINDQKINYYHTGRPFNCIFVYCLKENDFILS